MGKTDASSMTSFLYQIAGYPMQSKKDRLQFEVVLASNHTLSEEVEGWLAGQAVPCVVKSDYDRGQLRCCMIIFDNTMQAAIFKTRFMNNG